MPQFQNPHGRRDATGHMNPEYERELLDKSRENRSNSKADRAFIYRPRAGDELGEELGEAFVESATSGEEAGAERLDRLVTEEHGGPFIQSSAAIEFASGTDDFPIEVVKMVSSLSR
jgi:hypothetical protein